MSDDAPHPWTLHDPGETDAPARITDDNGAEVTPQRVWREIQILRAERNLLCAGRSDTSRKVQIVGDTCNRASTSGGPDYCSTCSTLLEDWVKWDGHTYREAKLIHSVNARINALIADRVEDLEAERQAVLDVINIYGDEVLHSQLDAIGWPWTDGDA